MPVFRRKPEFSTFQLFNILTPKLLKTLLKTRMKQPGDYVKKFFQHSFQHSVENLGVESVESVENFLKTPEISDVMSFYKLTII
jgi:hypothetical protein